VRQHGDDDVKLPISVSCLMMQQPLEQQPRDVVVGRRERDEPREAQRSQISRVLRRADARYQERRGGEAEAQAQQELKRGHRGDVEGAEARGPLALRGRERSLRAGRDARAEGLAALADAAHAPRRGRRRRRVARVAQQVAAGQVLDAVLRVRLRVARPRLFAAEARRDGEGPGRFRVPAAALVAELEAVVLAVHVAVRRAELEAPGVVEHGPVEAKGVVVAEPGAVALRRQPRAVGHAHSEVVVGCDGEAADYMAQPHGAAPRQHRAARQGAIQGAVKGPGDVD